jgi:hypothetical protein
MPIPELLKLAYDINLIPRPIQVLSRNSFLMSHILIKDMLAPQVTYTYIDLSIQSNLFQSELDCISVHIFFMEHLIKTELFSRSQCLKLFFYCFQTILKSTKTL